MVDGQSCALVGNEDGHKLGRLGLAGVLGHEMNGARGLEEAFPDLEDLDRAARELRANVTCRDIGRDGSGMVVRRLVG